MDTKHYNKCCFLIGFTQNHKTRPKNQLSLFNYFEQKARHIAGMRKRKASGGMSKSSVQAKRGRTALPLVDLIDEKAAFQLFVERWYVVVHQEICFIGE